MNACVPGLPRGIPLATVAIQQDGLHPLLKTCEVVWLPEGNGAALYEREEILALIPPWSGTNGFHGYARDNIGEGPVAWELGPNNVLFERFNQAQTYWKKWDDKEFWPSIQSSQISQLEEIFGSHTRYYAIDGGQWPPKAMVRFAWKGRTVLVTVGVALRPQPNVEMATETPELLRRIELGAVLPGSWSEDAVQGIGRYISGQCNLPWSNYTWLGPGHTLPCELVAEPAPHDGSTPAGAFRRPASCLGNGPGRSSQRAVVRSNL